MELDLLKSVEVQHIRIYVLLLFYQTLMCPSHCLSVHWAVANFGHDLSPLDFKQEDQKYLTTSTDAECGWSNTRIVWMRLPILRVSVVSLWRYNTIGSDEPWPWLEQALLQLGTCSSQHVWPLTCGIPLRRGNFAFRSSPYFAVRWVCHHNTASQIFVGACDTRGKHIDVSLQSFNVNHLFYQVI